MPDRSAREHTQQSGTRKRILAGALTALNQRGLRKLSIEDICLSAGISRRTLYRHFDSREEIITGASEHRREQFEIELAHAIQANPGLENRVAVVLGYLISAARLTDAYRLASSDLEFLRDSVAHSFDEYVEMIRITIEPIFVTHPALGEAGMSSRGLAELMMRFAMQALLTPTIDHTQAAAVFANFWRLAVRGAKRGG